MINKRYSWANLLKSRDAKPEGAKVRNCGRCQPVAASGMPLEYLQGKALLFMLHSQAAREKYGQLFVLQSARNERETVLKLQKTTWIILALAAAVVVMGGYIIVDRNTGGAQAAAGIAAASALPMEETQGAYVKPETLVDRSKNVTLPGWGGFTIPANTTHITQGFEFHNPDKNLWYEDHISIDGTELEKLVVDSGEATEISHYLKLAGIQSEAAEVTAYDKNCFVVDKTEDGALTLEAINGGFEGEKTITVQTEDGQTVTLTAASQQECYYISFGLYLSDGDELLYQSGLVAPGNYIQTMDLTRKLKPGEYDAYVVCQPYRSDKKTETNRGIVKITLTVG